MGSSSDSSKSVSDNLFPNDATNAPLCTICLDVVFDNAERSITKLGCGHFFHADCIGSEFNNKGKMKCPNCRKIENGKWMLFADRENKDPVEQTSFSTPDVVQTLPRFNEVYNQDIPMRRELDATATAMFFMENYGLPTYDFPSFSTTVMNDDTGNENGTVPNIYHQQYPWHNSPPPPVGIASTSQQAVAISSAPISNDPPLPSPEHAHCGLPTYDFTRFSTTIMNDNTGNENGTMPYFHQQQYPWHNSPPHPAGIASTSQQAAVGISSAPMAPIPVSNEPPPSSPEHAYYGLPMYDYTRFSTTVMNDNTGNENGTMPSFYQQQYPWHNLPPHPADISSTSQQAAVAISSILLAPIPVRNEPPTPSRELAYYQLMPSLDLSQEIDSVTSTSDEEHQLPAYYYHYGFRRYRS